MSTVKQLVTEFKAKGMSAKEAFEEITKLGMKAKKGTIAAYYSARPNTGAAKSQTRKSAARVTKTAQATGIRPLRTKRATDNTLWNATDIIEHVFTSNLVAAKKRAVVDLLLNNRGH